MNQPTEELTELQLTKERLQLAGFSEQEIASFMRRAQRYAAQQVAMDQFLGQHSHNEPIVKLMRRAGRLKFRNRDRR